MTAQEAQWLNQIIVAEELHVLFQPIVDATQQSIYGYEALIRGPKTSPLHSPLRGNRRFPRGEKMTKTIIITKSTTINNQKQLK